MDGIGVAGACSDCLRRSLRKFTIQAAPFRSSRIADACLVHRWSMVCGRRVYASTIVARRGDLPRAKTSRVEATLFAHRADLRRLIPLLPKPRVLVRHVGGPRNGSRCGVPGEGER